MTLAITKMVRETKRCSPCLPVEMPMGPMIDMVFLLLVFFLVNARSTPQEGEIPLSLPGTISQEQSIEIPEELRIIIAPNGQVFLNDLALDGVDGREMLALQATLSRLREAATANRSLPLITLEVADETNHQRIVDVLNACTKAQITSVTFAQDAEDL
jgi:biopolymer transport protein ExbD